MMYIVLTSVEHGISLAIEIPSFTNYLTNDERKEFMVYFKDELVALYGSTVHIKYEYELRSDDYTTSYSFYHNGDEEVGLFGDGVFIHFSYKPTCDELNDIAEVLAAIYDFPVHYERKVM